MKMHPGESVSTLFQPTVDGVRVFFFFFFLIIILPRFIFILIFYVRCILFYLIISLAWCILFYLFFTFAEFYSLPFFGFVEKWYKKIKEM